MPVRRAWSAVLACALAVAGLSGCSGHGSPGPPCCSASTYATDVTTAGRVRWQVPLARASPGGSSQLSPLAVGAVAVFTQTDVLYGLRLADGRRMWSRAFSQNITGMWRRHELVIVLTGSSLLTGLDAASGQVRWTQPDAGGADGSYPTADGGLAILSGYETLEVVDLSSGRVRWRRPAGYPPGPVMSLPPPVAVAGSAVLVATNGHLTSYDDRTGQIRWTDALMPIQLAASLGSLGVQAAAGLVYLTGDRQAAGGRPAPVLLGISAVDGRVKWQFTASPTETLGVWPPGLMSVTSSSGGTWQDELDPATGRVRWQAASAYDAITTPDGIVTAPGADSTDQISLRDTLTGQTRWTATLTGLTGRWRQKAPALPVFPAGPLLVVPAGGLAGPELLAALRMSDGHRAWQITIPEALAAPPSAAPGGMLVYSADLRLPGTQP